MLALKDKVTETVVTLAELCQDEDNDLIQLLLCPEKWTDKSVLEDLEKQNDGESVLSKSVQGSLDSAEHAQNDPFQPRPTELKTFSEKYSNFFQKIGFDEFLASHVAVPFLQMIQLHRQNFEEHWTVLENWWATNNSDSWAAKISANSRIFMQIHDNFWATLAINPSALTSEKITWTCATFENLLKIMDLDQNPLFARYSITSVAVRGVTNFQTLKEKLKPIEPFQLKPWNINFEQNELNHFQNSYIDAFETENTVVFRPEIKNLGRNFVSLLERAPETSKLGANSLASFDSQPAEHVTSPKKRRFEEPVPDIDFKSHNDEFEKKRIAYLASKTKSKKRTNK